MAVGWTVGCERLKKNYDMLRIHKMLDVVETISPFLSAEEWHGAGHGGKEKKGTAEERGGRTGGIGNQYEQQTRSSSVNTVVCVCTIAVPSTNMCVCRFLLSFLLLLLLSVVSS